MGIMYNVEARKKIKIGVDSVANAVKVTLGPKGRNVVIDKGPGSPTITNDGVSIAKEVELEDKYENIGAKLIKQVAERSNDMAGDGTTTSTVITQALVEEGLRYVETGLNPVNIRKGMEKAKDDVVSYLKEHSKKIVSKKEIVQVATISSESKETGELIASLMDEVGRDGVVTIEQSNVMGVTKEVVKGMNFDRGFISPYLVTDIENQVAEIENPSVIVTDKKISAISEILPLLEKATKVGKKDILLIAEDVDGEALATIIVNKMKGLLNILVVKAPEFGTNKKAILQDIAILTGAEFITQERGLRIEEAGISVLGSAGKVISDKDSTTIISGGGNVRKRIAEIRALIEKSTVSYETDKLKKRLAKLSSGVGVIKFGAATETEVTYLRHKLEDAVNATKSAVEEGIVCGGGTAFVRASQSMTVPEGNRDFQAGYETVLKAIQKPFLQIVENTGEDKPDVVLENVSKGKGNFGYNALEGRYEKDMIASGIIDPLKVTRCAIENAVSVASLFLTTECAIVLNDPKE